MGGLPGGEEEALTAAASQAAAVISAAVGPAATGKNWETGRRGILV